MLKRLISPLTSLAILLIVACHYDSEFLVWISIGVFGVLIINEAMYRQQTAIDGENKRLDLIISKLDQIMTKEERLQQAIADLNAATNDIAADLQRLKDELAAGNVSEESLSALETNIAVLKEIGNAQ